MDESPGSYFDAGHPLARMFSAPSTPGTETPSSVLVGGGGAAAAAEAGAAAKAGFPKDRVTRTVKKFDEKRNEKRVETGQIGRVTERKMDPIIQYTGRKVSPWVLRYCSVY